MLDTTQMQELESIIDAEYGFSMLLEAIASIANDKAEHIRESYNDETTAKFWEKRARTLDRLAHTPLFRD